jgi:hypothetical protein
LPEPRSIDPGILAEQTSRRAAASPQFQRAEHVPILGKTGMGKSFQLLYMIRQALAHCHGFFVDLYGDMMPTLLQLMAAEEWKNPSDLNTIVVEPAAADYGVGVNALEHRRMQENSVESMEFTAMLKQRWCLDSIGARTEELLRNSMLVLNLDKPRLGEQAAILGSLVLAELKTAMSSLQKHRLVTVYCDEIQHLVTFDCGLDLSEVRKFGVLFLTANQSLDHHLPARSVILLSGTDANSIASSYFEAFDEEWKAAHQCCSPRRDLRGLGRWCRSHSLDRTQRSDQCLLRARWGSAHQRRRYVDDRPSTPGGETIRRPQARCSHRPVVLYSPAHDNDRRRPRRLSRHAHKRRPLIDWGVIRARRVIAISSRAVPSTMLTSALPWGGSYAN